jgi:hypothetical protein
MISGRKLRASAALRAISSDYIFTLNDKNTVGAGLSPNFGRPKWFWLSSKVAASERFAPSAYFPFFKCPTHRSSITRSFAK